MIKVEHEHGDITHIHFGGDVLHNHPSQSEGGFILSDSGVKLPVKTTVKKAIKKKGK